MLTAVADAAAAVAHGSTVSAVPTHTRCHRCWLHCNQWPGVWHGRAGNICCLSLPLLATGARGSGDGDGACWRQRWRWGIQGDLWSCIARPYHLSTAAGSSAVYGDSELAFILHMFMLFALMRVGKNIFHVLNQTLYSFFLTSSPAIILKGIKNTTDQKTKTPKSSGQKFMQCADTMADLKPL